MGALSLRGADMIFILVLKGVLGLALVGEYDSADECKAAAQQYAAILAPEQTSPKQIGQLTCYGMPKQFPLPRETWEA
jgi:hypothetical protein